MTINVLMVAEKPSICTSIANALSKGNMVSHGRSPPVHEFSGTFQNKPAFFRVTSVTGHVFSVDFPKAFQNWDAVQPVELFNAPIVSGAEGKGGMVKHLEREAKNMDYLVLWLDCDREGENICFEVIRCVEKSMNRPPSFPPAISVSSSTHPRSNSSQNQCVQYQNVYRAKFSAVTLKDIEKAMQSLVSPNECESKAVEARQELDLKVGVAFSRFQTQYFQGKYGDLDSAVISYGPCQTPTLGFCVERYDDIQSFTPENFWNIDVTVDVNVNSSTTAAMGKSRQLVSLEWSRGRLFDQSIADTFIHLIRTDICLLCESIKVSETRKTRPTPMNTVEMLKMASSRLGIGPHATMKIAEELYLMGYLSYPRTESTSYPKSYDIRETLLEFKSPTCEYGSYVTELLKRGITPPRVGVDMGDHPPITPVSLAVSLTGDKARLYELIVRHFLATVSEDALFQSTKAVCRGVNSDEVFIMTGRRELSPGYLAIYHSNDYRNSDDEDSSSSGSNRCVELPESLREGQQWTIVEAKLRAGKTAAPGYLTESDLIGLMEKHGIGTDASIATHINNIVTRNYAAVGSGRTLVPTTLGIVLVHGYLRIDPALVLPDVRAAIESFCNMIARGEASKEQVVEHSLRNFLAKFQYFCSNINHMDSLFEASFSPLAATGKFLSKCGKCSRYMRYIPLKPQRLYCPTCEDTYSLPQNGTIKLYKEYKCPLDKFELVLFSLGNTDKAQGKSYPLCPYCFNYPPNFKTLRSSASSSSAEANGAINSSASVGENVVDTSQRDKMYNKHSIIQKQQQNSSSSSSSSSQSQEQQQEEQDIEDTLLSNEEDEQSDDDSDEFPYEHMGCNSCLHPSCKHSAYLNGVCECPGANASGSATCGGTLVLDVNSKPNWKLACNRCHTLLRFHADIHDITPIVREECPQCGVRMLKFEFSKTKTTLPNHETMYKGCIVCDDFLNAKTEIVLGRSINLQVLRQMRHKRGAGGRGGGRGRGRRAPRGDPKMTFHGF